jgi:hypothetical protein
MAYLLNGGNDEAYGFEKTIANFALKAVHESVGLVNSTTVVTPTQGNVFEIPLFAPITYQDYNPSTNSSGAATEQNPALGQSSITATPTYAATAFDVFYGFTTAFNLAATLGSELGESFAEKVDQRVAAAFASFKSTFGNTMYATSADGFDRVQELGAIALAASGDGTDNVNYADTVLGMLRLVKANWKRARLSGSPTVVLDADTQFRLLGELTGGAVNNNVSDLGNELLVNGSIQNIYGVSVVFSTFLTSGTGDVNADGSGDCVIGAYIGDQAVYTVMKQGLEVKMGEKPGGLQMWLTGVGYFGSGVGDMRRGGRVNIAV